MFLNTLQDVKVQSRDDGQLQEVSVTFGPHHALRIYEEDDEVCFRLVATHHRFDATASGDLPTELEDVINLVRKGQEDLVVGRIES